MARSEFKFTISDVAILLGKSPVTLRQWENKGLMKFPRIGDDRKFEIKDVRIAARKAKDLGRINGVRLRMVEAALTNLELIEHENRRNRSARIGQK